MTDISHSFPGYIQEEETQFRGATDAEIMTKLGGLTNFNLDTATSINSQLAGLLGATQQIITGATGFTTDGAGNFQGVLTNTSNGKPILLGIAYCEVASFTIYNQYPIATFGENVGLPLTNGGSANFQCQFVGAGADQLYGIVNNGVVSGLKGGSGPSWAPGTTGVIYWAIIFPAGS